jgi:hypothetical protein
LVSDSNQGVEARFANVDEDAAAFSSPDCPLGVNFSSEIMGLDLAFEPAQKPGYWPASRQSPL